MNECKAISDFGFDDLGIWEFGNFAI